MSINNKIKRNFDLIEYEDEKKNMLDKYKM